MEQIKKSSSKKARKSSTEKPDRRSRRSSKARSASREKKRSSPPERKSSRKASKSPVSKKRSDRSPSRESIESSHTPPPKPKQADVSSVIPTAAVTPQAPITQVSPAKKAKTSTISSSIKSPVAPISLNAEVGQQSVQLTGSTQSNVHSKVDSPAADQSKSDSSVVTDQQKASQPDSAKPKPSSLKKVNNSSLTVSPIPVITSSRNSGEFPSLFTFSTST
jgi:hypothetical protein